MKQVLRSAFSLTLIVLSVLGLMNVYSDNSEVVAMAGRVACASCQPRLVQAGRSPIAQTLTFQTGPQNLVVIECKRSLYFLGEYSCSPSPAAP